MKKAMHNLKLEGFQVDHGNDAELQQERFSSNNMTFNNVKKPHYNNLSEFPNLQASLGEYASAKQRNLKSLGSQRAQPRA